MGFSYTVAAVIMLSSTLIFFGIVYSSYVQSNTSITNANQKLIKNIYNLENTKIEIVSYYYNSSSSTFYVNVTDNGSTSFNLSESNVILNGTLISFNESNQYIFPLETITISFKASPGIYSFELVMPDGYEVFKEVKS
ncbi:hypothetical protein [Thermoplasma volcanium GSS1]|uniref:Uncharacterized protein n=1 Tax=Thermoplasma volcanium (strain ATCC 51530 / DSM 4299 / JCM 9571 / NBRC 15438 / GSS1) TaxID=273116 RepID=Q97B49_THEVO|nr:flagellar protein F [Thermoplasma volcanium]BAB59752.1 hypothetical protein [Thermoplasma volcanium GSS1]